MSISIINKAGEALANYLLDYGIVGEDGVGDIFTNGNTPASDDLPESYIEIDPNGAVTSESSHDGLLEFNLLLSLYVKLLGSGSTNTIRETFLLELLETVFNETLTIEKFHYSLNKRMMVYSGKSLVDGYSTKIININIKIY